MPARITLAALASLATVAAVVVLDAETTSRDGLDTSLSNPARLRSRPTPRQEAGTEASKPEAGTRPLGLDSSRDGLLHIPVIRASGLVPLLLMFHGAGGSGAQALEVVRQEADELGVVVVAPASRGRTWDALTCGWGPDVAFIDRALAAVFSAVEVDPHRVAVAGFSDGASYALGVGLANGDLFHHIAAFSPGFNPAPAAVGRPPVFVSHGTEDPVLPISRTSRVLVPGLQRAGYDVEYLEFSGGHTVPSDMVRRALSAAVAGAP